MSELEKAAAKRFAEALERTDPKQREGLLRYAEGYADCAADIARQAKAAEDTQVQPAEE